MQNTDRSTVARSRAQKAVEAAQRVTDTQRTFRSTEAQRQTFLEGLYSDYTELHRQAEDLQERKQRMETDSFKSNNRDIHTLLFANVSANEAELGDWETWERVESVVKKFAYGRSAGAGDATLSENRALQARLDTLLHTTTSQRKKIATLTRNVASVQEELQGLLNLLQMKDRSVRTLTSKNNTLGLQVRQLERECSLLRGEKKKREETEQLFSDVKYLIDVNKQLENDNVDLRAKLRAAASQPQRPPPRQAHNTTAATVPTAALGTKVRAEEAHGEAVEDSLSASELPRFLSFHLAGDGLADDDDGLRSLREVLSDDTKRRAYIAAEAPITGFVMDVKRSHAAWMRRLEGEVDNVMSALDFDAEARHEAPVSSPLPRSHSTESFTFNLSTVDGAFMGYEGYKRPSLLATSQGQVPVTTAPAVSRIRAAAAQESAKVRLATPAKGSHHAEEAKSSGGEVPYMRSAGAGSLQPPSGEHGTTHPRHLESSSPSTVSPHHERRRDELFTAEEVGTAGRQASFIPTAGTTLVRSAALAVDSPFPVASASAAPGNAKQALQRAVLSLAAYSRRECLRREVLHVNQLRRRLAEARAQMENAGPTSATAVARTDAPHKPLPSGPVQEPDDGPHKPQDTAELERSAEAWFADSASVAPPPRVSNSADMVAPSPEADSASAQTSPAVTVGPRKAPADTAQSSPSAADLVPSTDLAPHSEGAVPTCTREHDGTGCLADLHHLRCHLATTRDDCDNLREELRAFFAFIGELLFEISGALTDRVSEAESHHRANADAVRAVEDMTDAFVEDAVEQHVRDILLAQHNIVLPAAKEITDDMPDDEWLQQRLRALALEAAMERIREGKSGGAHSQASSRDNRRQRSTASVSQDKHSHATPTGEAVSPPSSFLEAVASGQLQESAFYRDILCGAGGGSLSAASFLRGQSLESWNRVQPPHLPWPSHSGAGGDTELSALASQADASSGTYDTDALFLQGATHPALPVANRTGGLDGARASPGRVGDGESGARNALDYFPASGVAPTARPMPPLNTGSPFVLQGRRIAPTRHSQAPHPQANQWYYYPRGPSFAAASPEQEARHRQLVSRYRNQKSSRTVLQLLRDLQPRRVPGAEDQLQPDVYRYNVTTSMQRAVKEAKARRKAAMQRLLSPQFDEYVARFVIPVASAAAHAKRLAAGAGTKDTTLGTAIHELRERERDRRRQHTRLVFSRVANNIRTRQMLQRHQQQQQHQQVEKGSAFTTYVAILYERWREQLEQQDRRHAAAQESDNAQLLRLVGLRDEATSASPQPSAAAVARLPLISPRLPNNGPVKRPQPSSSRSLGASSSHFEGATFRTARKK